MLGANRILFLLALIVSVNAFSLGAPNVGPAFEIHGHRGARAARPENTLAEFQYALIAGVTALEMDLGISKDNVVVVNHDLTVDTDLCVSTNKSLRSLQKPLVNDLTLSQIKTYDCGSIRNSQFDSQVLVPGSKIPTLIEVLRFLKASPLPQAKLVKINIETKIDSDDPRAKVGPEKFIDLVAQTILSEGFNPGRVILQSFDFRTIVYAKKKWPQLKTSALIDSLQDKNQVSKEVADIFSRTKADYISPDGSICSKELVNTAHSLGKKVLVWTINKNFHSRHFIKMGVDGIITDDPAQLIQYLLSARF